MAEGFLNLGPISIANKYYVLQIMKVLRVIITFWGVGQFTEVLDTWIITRGFQQAERERERERDKHGIEFCYITSGSSFHCH
jgi:hypothetical protein